MLAPLMPTMSRRIWGLPVVQSDAITLGHALAGTAKVGSVDGGKDHSPKTVVSLTGAADVDYASFVRLDDGTRPVGWDMS